MGQNLIYLRAYCLREWPGKSLYGSQEVILSPLRSSSKGVYHITSDIPGQEMSGKYLNDQLCERPRDLDCKASNMLKEKGYPGGKVLIFPILPIVVFHPGDLPYLAHCPCSAYA